MSLRARINLIVALLTLLFVAAVLLLELRAARDSVREETVAANRVAAQLLNSTVLRYAAQGTPLMLTFLHSLGRVRANDIVLLDDAGQRLYASPPSPYKAGRDAPQWVSPPPVVHSISFPGGRLEVHANASRAVLDAWDDVRMLALAALALLLLANGLVFWLVGRALRPLARITAALREVGTGRMDIALPPLPGGEAQTIGTAFIRMVGALAQHIETERRAVAAETRLAANRELTRWIDGQIEQERRLIAHELHDEFGQSVTALRSLALSIEQRVAGSDPTAAQAARAIADESSRLYDAMHGIIPRLAPLVLDRFGLAEALGELVERTRAAHPQLRIDAELQLADGSELAPEVALAVYRAAQEGITNAIQHGAAQRLQLQVSTVADEVRLALRDDGSGLPPQGWRRAGHYGLRWLEERVASLGGSVAIESIEPHGVRLALRLPAAAAPPASIDVPTIGR